MKYRIPEPGTTISGFDDNNFFFKNWSRPTDPRFFWNVTVNTLIFFFGLAVKIITNQCNQLLNFMLIVLPEQVPMIGNKNICLFVYMQIISHDTLR